jgi:hypothetical protein
VLHSWLRLTFAIVWGVIGVALLLRPTLFPAEFLGQFDPSFLTAGGMLAVFLACYNLLRWWMVIRRPRRSGPLNPLARPITNKPPREYNPELDFTTRPPGSPPNPA